MIQPLTTVGLFLVFSLGSANAACSPGAVNNITYFSNHTLEWEAAANPYNCTISSYIVNVIDEGNGIVYQFQTNGIILSYVFSDILEICKTYLFEVHALTTEYVLGPSATLNKTIAAPQDINLSLSGLNVTTNASDNQVNLTWHLLNNEASKCVSYYRVVYWDESNTPKDTYVHTSNVSLKEVIPCNNYTVQVNAIIASPSIDGPVSKVILQVPQKVPTNPKLVSIVTSNSTVDMIWRLEPLADNYCTLIALNVYTLGETANNSYVRVPILNNDPRPDVEFTLTGLARAHVYTSLVNVQNQAGTSENVTVLFQTSDK